MKGFHRGSVELGRPDQKLELALRKELVVTWAKVEAGEIMITWDGNRGHSFKAKQGLYSSWGKNFLYWKDTQRKVIIPHPDFQR